MLFVSQYRLMQFDQSSQVYPKKYFFSKKSENVGINFFAKQNAILLVLPIEEFSLQPKLCSPPPFQISGGVH